MPRTTPDRARSEEAKSARWLAILDAAATVFDGGELESFTMEAVAAEVGLVKGALYRYVRTRETLLLALTGAEYRRFFDAVDTALASTARSRVAVATAIVEAALARPRFLRLLAFTPTVLERNVPVEVAVAFKSDLLARGGVTAAGLATALRCDEAAAWQLLVQVQAAAVGLHQHAQPAPVVREALGRPELAPLCIDLRDELTHAVAALVAAVPRRRSPERRRPPTFPPKEHP